MSMSSLLVRRAIDIGKHIKSLIQTTGIHFWISRSLAMILMDTVLAHKREQNLYGTIPMIS